METKNKKPTYKERNGSTWVGDALRKLKDISPEILNAASSIPGLSGLKIVGDLIKGSTTISKEDKEILLKELEKDIALEMEVTKRWQADMSSDSWMSKNIRPIGLAWVLIMTTALMVVSWLDIATPQQVIMMFGGLASTIVGGYYVLRTVEKRNEKKYKD